MGDYPIVDLSTDELLTTTRSVRKCLDLTKPLPIGLIRECLDCRASSDVERRTEPGDCVVVADAEQRRAIGDVYRRTWDWIVTSPFANPRSVQG